MATNIFKAASPIKKGTPVPTTVVSPAKLRSAKLSFSQELARDIENLATNLNALYSLLANVSQAVSIPAASTKAAGLVKPDGTSISVGSDGTLHGALLETNSVENGSQAKLNLIAGTNVLLSDDGAGNITASVPPVWQSWTGDEDAGGHNLSNVDIIGTSGLQVSGFLTFQNWASMNYTHGAATYMTTNNASGGAWPEFSYFLNPGGTLAADIFNFAVNTRTTVGGADNWIDAMQISMLTAAVLFPNAVEFSLAPTFGDPAGTLTNLIPAWANYTPTISGGGSMTVSGVTITDAQYVRLGPLVFFKLHFSCTFGGTLSNSVSASAPVALVGDGSKVDAEGALTSGTPEPIEGHADATLGFELVNAGAANFTAANYTFLVSGFYRCA